MMHECLQVVNSKQWKVGGNFEQFEIYVWVTIERKEWYSTQTLLTEVWQNTKE